MLFSYTQPSSGPQSHLWLYSKSLSCLTGLLSLLSASLTLSLHSLTAFIHYIPVVVAFLFFLKPSVIPASGPVMIPTSGLLYSLFLLPKQSFLGFPVAFLPLLSLTSRNSLSKGAFLLIIPYNYPFLSPYWAFFFFIAFSLT